MCVRESEREFKKEGMRILYMYNGRESKKSGNKKYQTGDAKNIIMIN